jgi:hypothetical protein
VAASLAFTNEGARISESKQLRLGTRAVAHEKQKSAGTELNRPQASPLQPSARGDR